MFYCISYGGAGSNKVTARPFTEMKWTLQYENMYYDVPLEFLQGVIVVANSSFSW